MGIKKIILFGAGRSARHLVSFLVEGALSAKWQVVIADTNVTHWLEEYGTLEQVKFVLGDASDAKFRHRLISSSSLVISMLPAYMHAEVVRDCINFHVHVFTPSYVSPEVNAMNERALQEGVLVLNEMGVDPGIDHISAMEIIHRLKGEGAEIDSFESYTGGLVAPASDDNLWGYKISWNPRNIILAGNSGYAMYRENNKLRMVPYYKLFDEVETVVASDGYLSSNTTIEFVVVNVNINPRSFLRPHTLQMCLKMITSDLIFFRSMHPMLMLLFPTIRFPFLLTLDFRL